MPEVPDVPDGYPFINLILMFFIFSLIGFVWEVIYITVTERVTANRGMLHGPWLPIYGIGGILILLLFTPFRHNPFLVFVLAALMCTVIEYITAVASERVFGCRWWDYSNKKLNLKGRICLAGGMLFGMCGIFGACYLGPVLNSMLSGVSMAVRLPTAVILCLILAADVIFSFMFPNKGRGITYPLADGREENEKNNKENSV